MPTAVPKIKLRSSDGEVFEIYRDAAKLSELIMEKLENRESGDEEPVYLHRVDSSTLKMVIEFCEHHMDDGPENQEVRIDEHGEYVVDPWDKALLEVESVALFERFCNAAEYLGIGRMKDIIRAFILNSLP